MPKRCDLSTHPFRARRSDPFGGGPHGHDSTARLCIVRCACGAADAARRCVSVARVSAVLIAEPEPGVRGFLERHLAQDGFDVVGTDDHDAALELASRAHPDLVLLGDPSALEAFMGVPVIVIGSAESDAVDRVRAFARGCDDFVARPFVYDELVARMNAVLRRAKPAELERLRAGPISVELATRRVERRRRARRPRRQGVRAAREARRRSRTASSRRRSCCARCGTSDRSAGRGRSTRTRRACGGSCRRCSPGRSSSTSWRVGYRLLD